MSADMHSTPTPKWMFWTGWFLSVLSALTLIMSAAIKFAQPPDLESTFRHLGWHVSVAVGLGVVELLCAIVYLIPRSSVLGAILITGYLGGALASHIRVADPFVREGTGPLIMGTLVWLGLVFRHAHLRALLPFGKEPARLSLLLSIPLTFAAIVLTLFLAILLQPADFHLERSATMVAPPAAVFAQINDFHKWQKWSPWRELDPNAKETIEGAPSGTGAVFKWSGNDSIGEGSLTILESKHSEFIKIRFDFVRPRPDTATIEFRLKPQDDRTIVTWIMTGERDLLGKAICSVLSMEKMVGGSYEKGLANIKAIVEAPPPSR